MKFGKILYNYGEAALHNPGYNLGDGIQTIAMENIYRFMGVPDDEVIGVEICDLNTYDGEYVLLPMYSMAFGIGYAKLPLSPKIIPLFISTHIAKTELNQDEVAYLRSYSPVGCRDEFSLNTMRRYGIPAYLSGCITATMPKRQREPAERKVFFVDTPDSLKDYIPKSILEKAVFETHIVPIENRVMTREDAYSNYKKSKARLERYMREATLMVSSKQHAIIPCMAGGIPVIAACENISQRFSWFDKYIPIYSESSFAEIDWSPKPIDYEDKKYKLLQFFAKRLQDAYDQYEPFYAVSEFYENRNRARYGSFYYDRLMRIRKLGKTDFEYLIWGCGLIGNTCQRIMEQAFPQAKLIAGVDNFVTGEWQGVKVIQPKDLNRYKDRVIILATYSGREECFAKMKELGLAENIDFFYCGTQNG